MPPDNPAAAFSWFIRAKAISRKVGLYDAEQWIAVNKGPAAAARLLKASVAAGSSLDSDVDAQTVIGAFSDTLRSASAFYRIYNDNGFRRFGLRQRVGLLTSSPTAAVRTDGAAIPVSRIVISNDQVLEPIEIGSMIVMSDTLLNDISSAGQQLLNRELRSLIGAAVDTVVFDRLVGEDTDALTFASSGVTAADCMADLRQAMMATNSIGAEPKLYWVSSVDTAKMISTLASVDGIPVHQGATALGGQLLGLPLLISSGVASGELYLLEASSIGAASSLIDVSPSTQADIEMDTAPAGSSAPPTSANLVSMWTTNSTAVRTTVSVGVLALAPNAIARITGISYGGA